MPVSLVIFPTNFTRLRRFCREFDTRTSFFGTFFRSNDFYALLQISFRGKWKKSRWQFERTWPMHEWSILHSRISSRADTNCSRLETHHSCHHALDSRFRLLENTRIWIGREVANKRKKFASRSASSTVSSVFIFPSFYFEESIWGLRRKSVGQKWRDYRSYIPRRINVRKEGKRVQKVLCERMIYIVTPFVIRNIQCSSGIILFMGHSATSSAAWLMQFFFCNALKKCIFKSNRNSGRKRTWQFTKKSVYIL